MSNRYRELKYNGKTYTQKYEIDEILLDNGMNWFLDAEIENVRIEIMKDTLILNGGIIYNCVWEYGVIRDGDIRNMRFCNGVIYNGTFKRIKVEKGIIFDGIFIRGDVLFADIRGGEFKDVNISNNVNQTEKEEIPQEQDLEVQPENTQVQAQPVQVQIQAQPVQVKGEVPKGQEGQEIQSQVQESRIVKTFEAFLGGRVKKTFENYHDTKPELVIKDLGDTYGVNKIELEGKMHQFFREKHEILSGDNSYELVITYDYETWGGNNPEDIQNAITYLESLPGVETVIHRMGFKFELTFDKPVEIY